MKITGQPYLDAKIHKAIQQEAYHISEYRRQTGENLIMNGDGSFKVITPLDDWLMAEARIWERIRNGESI